MKVQFKFKEQAPKRACQQVIKRLSQSGAKGIRRLFPGKTDRELASLYIADVTDEKTEQELLDLLNTSKVVEFAEKEVRRKLIRQERGHSFGRNSANKHARSRL